MNLLYYSLRSSIRWMAITHFRNNPISCWWTQWMKWKVSHRGLGKIFLLIHSLKENVHITPNKSIQKSSTLMGRSTNTTVLHKPLKMSHNTDRPLEKQQNKKQNNSTIMNKHKRKWIRQYKLTYATHSRQKWISSSSFSISTAHKHLDSVLHFINSCMSNHRVNHKWKILNCTKKANHTSDTYCFFSTTHP